MKHQTWMAAIVNLHTIKIKKFPLAPLSCFDKLTMTGHPEPVEGTKGGEEGFYFRSVSS